MPSSAADRRCARCSLASERAPAGAGRARCRRGGPRSRTSRPAPARRRPGWRPGRARRPAGRSRRRTRPARRPRTRARRRAARPRPDEPDREQQPAGDRAASGAEAEASAWASSVPSGSALTTTAPDDRRELPHLDDQQHGQEQGADERRERSTKPRLATSGLAVVPPGRDRAAGAGPARGGGPPATARATRASAASGRLDEEDRPPVEQLGQQATEGRAERGADRGGPGPPRPARRVGAPQGAEHGDAAAEEQGGADALRRTGRRAARRTSRPGRRRATPPANSDEPDAGEHRRAHPAGQQRDAEGGDGDDHGVGGQHPRDADDGRVELAVEVGQGQHHDRRVGEGEPDRDHEQRRQHRALAPRDRPASRSRTSSRRAAALGGRHAEELAGAGTGRAGHGPPLDSSERYVQRRAAPLVPDRPTRRGRWSPPARSDHRPVRRRRLSAPAVS